LSRAAEVAARYDELLLAADPADVALRIEEGARALRVTYGDRLVCNVLKPFFIDLENYRNIVEHARLVLEALHLACGEFCRDRSTQESLGLTDTERHLISLTGGFTRHDLIGRLDSFLDSRGLPAFLEYNGESPGGIAYGDCLGEVFESLPLMQELGGNFDITRRPVIPEVVEAFREEYESWATSSGRSPESTPLIAIVDFRDIPTMGEFHIFKEAFERAGMRCCIAAPEDLILRKDGLFVGEEKLDIVYRRLITPDILETFGGEHVLIEAIEQNHCFVANGLGGYAVSHKGLFAILSDPARRPGGLGSDHVQAVDAAIPWTRMVSEDTTCGPKGGDPLPLETIAKQEKDTLVIKPASSYGGKDVVLGWTVDDATWNEAWVRGLDVPTVIQRRVEIPTKSCPVLVDDALKFVPMQFDVDPYVLRGSRIHGLGVRFSGGDLLNVASGSGSAVPAFIVE